MLFPDPVIEFYMAKIGLSARRASRVLDERVPQNGLNFTFETTMGNVGFLGERARC